MKEKNLATFFQNRVYRFGTRPAISYKRDGNWIWLNWEELARSIEAIGRGLIALRVEPGDRVAIFSENRPEWVCFDLAVQSVGAISVPIYAESSSKQAEFILKNSGALVVAVGTTIQMERVLSSRPNLPTLRAAVLFDETSQSVDEFVHPLSEVHTKAREVPAATFYARIENLGSDDISTLMYTSGSEGDPKGVVLTHGNILSNLLAAASVFPVSEADTALSFLPLSHAFERTGFLALLSLGSKIALAESVPKLLDNLQEVKPSILLSVPGVLEKFYRGVREEISKRRRPIRFLFKKGSGVKRNLLARKSFDILFAKKIRQRLGGRIEYLISGGAALNPKVAQFLETIGIRCSKGTVSRKPHRL